MHNLENELNNEQYEAVRTIEGPLLIIAGAGSGKTRVITFRIANMLSKSIPQSSILALTFTNKAAREMAERVKLLTGKRLSNLTVSTFHAFGVKILRETIHLLGFKDNFSIYDTADKMAVIKEVARELKFSIDGLDLFSLGNDFSAIKTGRSDWKHVDTRYKALYEEYNEHLKLYNAVDFEDLIVLPQKIFQNFPDVLEQYHEKYKYIMVDEFQDTSMAQYSLMKTLALKYGNICVVGDDDQSIYSWRGANYDNILNFEKDFHAKEIKLEQNYRSTKNILTAANTVIANNKNRKLKELWTGDDHGKAIELFYPDSDSREAVFIAEMIRSIHLRESVQYDNFGILVRTNGLCSAIEDALLTENIPYKVSGGTSFFQRKEIRDIISYLRVISNPDDDVNFLRIINTPRRGVGKASLQAIKDFSEIKQISLYSAVSVLRWEENTALGNKIRSSLDDFISMIEYYRERILSGKKMAQSLRSLVETIEYWPYLIGEHQKSEKLARYKYSNILKFVDFLERWESDPDNMNPNIYSYLNRITLVTRDDDQSEDSGEVNLMTIHASKGLEFDIVFLAGVEDHIIPHARSIEENPENIEEERRLFYVAITRARKKLFMTACRSRRQVRDVLECTPSPFLNEIPEELIEFHKPETETSNEDAIDYFEKMKAKFQ